jgi:hypothetical protein
MKMRSVKSRRSGALLSVPFGLGIAMANTANATEQWVTDNVKFVYPQADGSFIISFVNPQPICTSTASPQYFTVQAGHNDMTTDGVKGLMASSLAALIAGKQIQLALEAATNECYVNRLSIVG